MEAITVQQKDSLELQLNTSETKYSNEEGDFLTIYNDIPLKISDWKEGIKQLRAAFPKIEDSWFDLLTTKMKEKKFTQKQFNDAIDNVISTCKYPTPQIANIINYQKGVRIISRERFLRETKDESKEFRSYFVGINVNGELFYANKHELERLDVKYNLWNKPISNKTTIYPEKEKTFESLSKSFNMLTHFNNIIKKLESNSLYQEWKDEIKNAGKNWGVDADEYLKAKNRCEILEQKLGIY